uniref:Uncharacterized protein n=1 Tax=Physcomitrium patens TaxID=3218 RepID=A0A2K1KFA0_PHYPA|nr:hypothetical protein PHYPA_008835 [Physcomitrium patens]
MASNGSTKQRSNAIAEDLLDLQEVEEEVIYLISIRRAFHCCLSRISSFGCEIHTSSEAFISSWRDS